MIEIIKDLPPNVLGIRAEGRVTAQDYEHIVVPAVEASLKGRDKIRLYYELGSEFEAIDPGAIVEDTKIGVRDLPHWEKLAVVTDVEWIKLAVRAFAFLIHGKVRIFPVLEAGIAREWISAA